jgi:hypothetical protein
MSHRDKFRVVLTRCPGLASSASVLLIWFALCPDGKVVEPGGEDEAEAGR